MKEPLEIRIDLNVLQHLGMNLYGSMPPVLSEIVANAWDADARAVDVRLDRENGRIAIQDDGHGMNRHDVASRFLVVGYPRRDAIGPRTPGMGRLPMGRKGIGKLSSFSIAGVVTVHTAKDGERTAFRIDAEAIREHARLERDEPFRPEELPAEDWPEKLEQGTLITLSKLKRSIRNVTQKKLRTRLARRFSVIGPEHGFRVRVNGQEIRPGDRGYCANIEYLWTYNGQAGLSSGFPSLPDGGRSPEQREEKIELGSNGGRMAVSGWIGTTSRLADLKDEKNSSLNRLAVYMRGKLAHEDILEGFGEKRLYANYLVGEIRCDELDRDDEEDIATSNRQSLKEDDPRFAALKDFLQGELGHIAGRWSEWRREDGGRAMAGEVPGAREWLDEFKGDTRRQAERWIGRLNTLNIESDRTRRELLKASILAFEVYHNKERIAYLETLPDENVGPVLEVLGTIDDLQSIYYGEIVRMRIQVIRKLQAILRDDEKEAVIQKHLFDNLWLLDPSWERAPGSEACEKSMANALKESSGKLTKEERRGRIDIGYRKVSGRHVIIEMKRASVSVSIYDLLAQVEKYRAAARKILARSSDPEWPVEIVCLLGKPPMDWQQNRSMYEKMLDAGNARILFYDHLLENALKAYQDYLDRQDRIDRLRKIFDSIDNLGGGE